MTAAAAMRVVLAADGSRGDVQPMLVLGAALRAGGHEVTVCAPPGFAAEARDLGLEAHGYPFDFRQATAELAEETVAGGRRALAAARRIFGQALESQFELLPPVARGADVIVGAGPAMATTSVAEAVGARHYSIAYVPTALRSSAHPPIVLGARRLPRLVNRGLWWMVRRQFNRMLLAPLNAHRQRLGLAGSSDAYATFVGRDVIAAFDPELAAVPADARFAVSQVGYLHSPERPALPADLSAFLEAGPPPIYVGFGSMHDPEPEATTQLIALAAERAEVRVVIGGGWAGLGAGAESDRIHVIDQVAHASLFPRCAGAVHHGGAGTTAAAARAGIPQLAIPHLMDQPYWAMRVTDLGIGPRPIRRPRLCVDRLARGLRSLVADRECQSRAGALGEALRQRDAVRAAVDVIAGSGDEATTGDKEGSDGGSSARS